MKLLHNIAGVGLAFGACSMLGRAEWRDPVAVNASLNFYVFDNETAIISEFAAGATGNVAPMQAIAGSATELSEALGLVVTE